MISVRTPAGALQTLMGGTKFCIDARTATPHFPGVGRYVSNLIPGVAAELAHDEQMLVILPSAAPFTLEDGSDPRIGTLATSISPFSATQQWVVPRLLKEQGADLYHSSYYLMPYRPRVPTLLTAYDLIPIFRPSSVSMRARLFFRVAHAMALRSASRVIAISESTRQELLRFYGLSPDRVVTIQLGVSPSFRQVPSLAVQDLREKFALPSRFVLYVGINKPHKNLSRLVEAWKTLIEKSRLDTPLVMAGPWDRRYSGLRQLVSRLHLDEHIRWLGPVDAVDLPRLYSAATLFVFPSLHEGFGLPVLEAMACGTPVACSRIPSLEEVGGGSVHFFDPENTRSIADALEELLDDPGRREDLSGAGLLRAAEFTWERNARQTISLYRDLLGRFRQ